MISRKILRAALVLMLMGASFAFSRVTFAAPVQWKMHLVWAGNRVETHYYKQFAELVNKRAEGKLHITVYDGGSLGIKDVDMLRILPKANVVQIAGLYPGYLTRDEPAYAVTLAPGAIADAADTVAIYKDFAKIYQKTYDKWGIKLLGFVAHPVRDTSVVCKTPVNDLRTLRQHKLRVWEKMQVDTFQRLGVSAQIVPQNNLYLAMQTGVVDCAVYPLHFALTLSLQEVAPNASYLFPYTLQPLNLIVAKKAFDALPPEVQAIVEAAALEVQSESAKTYIAGSVDREAEHAWVEKGGKINKPFDQADQTAFTQAANTAWEIDAKELGGVAEANYQSITQALAKVEK
ncbi:hypothetical protein CDEF62S_00352 [Castellaniella defragrans]